MGWSFTHVLNRRALAHSIYSENMHTSCYLETDALIWTNMRHFIDFCLGQICKGCVILSAYGLLLVSVSIGV